MVGIAAYLVVHVVLFTYFYPIHAAEVIPTRSGTWDVVPQLI